MKADKKDNVLSKNIKKLLLLEFAVNTAKIILDVFTKRTCLFSFLSIFAVGYFNLQTYLTFKRETYGYPCHAMY